MVSFMMNLTNSNHQKNQDLIVFSEEEQFQRIFVLLKQDVPSALKLARKKLRSKKYFHCLLEEGLESADASEIETWLSYLVPCLGVRTVVNVLEGQIHEKPWQVEKTIYWLEKFVNNEKELNL
jgi:hypothetical protein